jgi:hypothetical protein
LSKAADEFIESMANEFQRKRNESIQK